MKSVHAFCLGWVVRGNIRRVIETGRCIMRMMGRMLVSNAWNECGGNGAPENISFRS